MITRTRLIVTLYVHFPSCLTLNSWSHMLFKLTWTQSLSNRWQQPFINYHERVGIKWHVLRYMSRMLHHLDLQNLHSLVITVLGHVWTDKLHFPLLQHFTDLNHCIYHICGTFNGTLRTKTIKETKLCHGNITKWYQKNTRKTRNIINNIINNNNNNKYNK
jgi:hypothetical protein